MVYTKTINLKIWSVKLTKIFEHILVPYNGTIESNKAYKKAIAMASSINAKITIFTCLERRSIFALFKKKAKKEELNGEKKIVENQHKEMINYAEQHGVTASSKIERGDYASEKILDFAQQHKIDLIILSKKKFSSHSEKFHYHSTVEAVSKNSDCAILIIN